MRCGHHYWRWVSWMICCDFVEWAQQAIAKCIHISPLFIQANTAFRLKDFTYHIRMRRERREFNSASPPTTLWVKRQGFVNFDWIPYLGSLQRTPRCWHWQMFTQCTNFEINPIIVRKLIPVTSPRFWFERCK